MGEAKRKQMEIKNAAITAPLDEVNKEFFTKALRQVITAVNNNTGADCIFYSVVGAGLLKKLGIDAISAAGSAVWRVGPGDSDTISHASEIQGQYFIPSGTEAALFHCWIETTPKQGSGIYPEIIDPTTWQLAKKGREMDAADGGTTVVDFCPDYLWINAKSIANITPQSVVNSFDTGVYTYIRKPDLEAKILTPEVYEDTTNLVAAALLCYQSLVNGSGLRVLGIGESGIEEADENIPLQLKKAKMY